MLNFYMKGKLANCDKVTSENCKVFLKVFKRFFVLFILLEKKFTYKHEVNTIRMNNVTTGLNIAKYQCAGKVTKNLYLVFTF